MDQLIHIKLIKFYIRRAQCYMKMAERFGKIRYARSASEDCSFIRDNKLFERGLKEVGTDNKVLEDSLREITIKADEFIAAKEAIEANIETQRNV